MARKKIGLFMNEITQFFQEACGRALVREAYDRDMDLIIYASYGSYSCPYGRNLLSEIGKKNIIHLPDYSSFDAIIVLPNTFDIVGMDTEFFSLVRENATCPVICLQSNISEQYPRFYSITIGNTETMYTMTKHLIEEHGCSDICYMSGPFTSKDSPDRMKGFKLAMEEAGLSVGPNTIYEGNYWMNRGAKAVDFFLTDRDDYPQAIICANDYMALSICDELKKRGKKIPDDVAVTGFDGIIEGLHNDPQLTTVTISPESYAKAAIKIIDDIFAGGHPEHLITLSDEIIIRESCGCRKKIHHKSIDYHTNLQKLNKQDFLLREAGRITADYHNQYDIRNSLSVADYYFQTLGCDTGYLCFCDDTDPALKSMEQDLIYTDKMILMQKMKSSARMHAEVTDERFDRSDILPLGCFDTDEPGTYVIYPIYYKNKEYGYLVLKPEVGEWPNSLTNTYTNALSSALENNYYHKQFMEYAEIKNLSEIDPLTGLYNRRGFENRLSNILSAEESEPSRRMNISIASIDMDDLKTINDIFGHTEGDNALCIIADSLRKCTSDDEICARFGGDEFVVVLRSRGNDRIREFTMNFDRLLDEASKTLDKSYVIHASVGVCALKGRDTKDIFVCMQTADEKMYVNKRNYKM